MHKTVFKNLSWIVICLCNHRNYIELKPLISIQICLKWLIYLWTIYVRFTVWQVFTCDSYTWPDKASRQYEPRSATYRWETRLGGTKKCPIACNIDEKVQLSAVYFYSNQWKSILRSWVHIRIQSNQVYTSRLWTMYTTFDWKIYRKIKELSYLGTLFTWPTFVLIKVCS